MKKRTKLLLVLLSAATMTAGVVGLAGCKDKDNNTDSTSSTSVEQLYENYKNYATEHGETVLTKEEWIEIIQSKLKGDKGDPGTPGKDGTTTEAVSIDEIVMGTKDDKKGLEIIYSDGTSDFVELPEEVTHEHDYEGSEIRVLIAPTDNSEGLGYKKCKGCDHIELVVLNVGYLVTVEDSQGNPIEGAEVTINGARGLTDADGFTSVAGYGAKNDYIIDVKKAGKAVMGQVRTGDDPYVTVTMVDEFGKALDDYGYECKSIEKASTYSITVGTETDIWNAPMSGREEVLLIGGDQPKYYKITPQGLGDLCASSNKLSNSILTSGSYSVVVYPGEKVKLYFGVNIPAFVTTGGKAYDSVTYAIKVEEQSLPAEGSKEYPYNVQANQAVAVPAAGADGWVYYRWNNKADILTSAKINIAEGSEIKFGQAQWDAENNKFNYVEIDVEPNTSFDLVSGSTAGSHDFKFRVKPAAGATELTVDATIPVGSKFNPVEANGVGTYWQTYEGIPDEYDVKWFKMTVAEEVEYYIEPTTASDAVPLKIYYGMPQDENVDAYKELYSAGVVSLKPNNYGAVDYYFAVPNKQVESEYKSAFGIETLDPEKHAGLALSCPKALEVTFNDGTATVDIEEIAADATRYYEFTAPSAGTLTHTITQDSMGNWYSYKITVYRNGEKVDVAAFNKDDKVVLECYNGAFSDYAANVTFTWTEKTGGGTTDPVDPDNPNPPVDPDKPVADPVDHTFTIKDSSGAPVQGVTVTVGKVSGTTDEQGQVTLNFVPGSHSVSFSTYNTQDYRAPLTSTNGNDRAYDITLFSEKKEYTFKLQTEDGSKTFSYASVTLIAPTGETMDSTTDEKGEVKFTVLPPDGSEYKLDVVPVQDSSGDYYGLHSFTYGYINSQNKDTTTAIAVVLEKYATYSVNLVGVDGAPLNGVTLQLSYKNGNDVVVADTATTSYGYATLKAPAMRYEITCIEGLPEGTNAPALVTNYDEYNQTFNIKLAFGDRAATANDTLPGAAMADSFTQCHIGDGLNVLNNANAEGYYFLKLPSAGRYKLELTEESSTSFINYLRIGDNNVLIANGKQQAVAYNIVLGKNRGMNKVYELEFETNTVRDWITVGFNTGKDAGGVGNLKITKVGDIESVDPDFKTVGAGTNNIVVNNKPVECSYHTDDTNVASLKLEWTDANVTITNEYGQEVHSGDSISPNYMGDAVFTITSSTPVTFTLTVTEEGDPYGGW